MKPIKLAILSMILASGIGCTTATIGTSDYCRLYQVVGYSPRTPDDVQRDIDLNDVVWCRLCDPECDLEPEQ